MKPLDDLLPEEAHHAELILSLRQTYRSPESITASEREEAIARARERLSSQISETTALERAMSIQSAGTTGSSLPPAPGPGQRPRRVHMIRVLNTIAALLVVGAIIAVLISRHQAPSQISSFNRQEGETIVTSSAGGFEMVMRLTGGPYFLSEMLAVDLSLTNHTDQAVNPGFPFEGYTCGYNSSYDTGVQIVGGSAPIYTLPLPADHRCVSISQGNIVLKAGQTLSVHRYLPLTRSGQMTLVGKTQFYQPGANHSLEPVASPLEKHWPSLPITVSPHIPADRTLSIQRTNTQVTVLVPPGKQLVYMYAIFCTNTGGGNFGWQPLSTTTIKPSDDSCRSMQVDWTFAFAVPGYAILTGKGQFQAP